MTMMTVSPGEFTYQNIALNIAIDDTVITLADWSVFVATNSHVEVNILHTGTTSRLKSQERDQLPTLH